MWIVWILIPIDLAVGAFAGYLACELDFFDTGINAAQFMAGSVVLTLVLSAGALAWSRSVALWRIAFGLEALDLLAVLALSAWYSLTSPSIDTPNPMHFYWMHFTAAGLVFAVNLAAMVLVADRAP
jgi:hypothetical protein